MDANGGDGLELDEGGEGSVVLNLSDSTLTRKTAAIWTSWCRM
jgi:hypothetical protein